MIGCDKLNDLSAKHIGGWIGGMLDACIENGVMTPKYRRYAQAWSEKTDTDGLFCGEFWGKWATSAAAACRYRPQAEYRELLGDAVKRLLAAQEPDGRLSCSRKDFSPWDVWGRKYALLGLVSWFDLTGDRAALGAACRALDELISRTMDAGVNLAETGLAALTGLPSCSVLQPVVQLYGRTGRKRYLEYAEWIVGLWEKPNAYASNGIRLLSAAAAGTPPVEIGCPKGYETVSCLEGVCELARFTGKQEYLDAVLAYAAAAEEHELMVTGSGSSAELWCEGRFRQTEILEAPMETCVTATWMKFCHQLLRLTGDAHWADELELSLFNALAGAMKSDGSWWAYYSPLQGQRVYSQVQIPYVSSSCCVVNGPRALTEVPQWAMMARPDGFAVCLYQEGEYAGEREGEVFRLRQETAYPCEGTVRLTVEASPRAPFVLALRIPSWSRRTQVRVCGEPAQEPKAGWFEVRRAFRPGDVLELTFDTAPRILRAPGGGAFRALASGPVVLGLDDRFVQPGEHESLWLMNDAMEWVRDDQLRCDYVRVQSLRQESAVPLWAAAELPQAHVAYRVRFLKRPIHFMNHETRELTFCDYASCGGDFAPDRSFCVWFPDPLYTDTLFARGTRPVISCFSTGEDAFRHEETSENKETR